MTYYTVEAERSSLGWLVQVPILDAQFHVEQSEDVPYYAYEYIAQKTGDKNFQVSMVWV